MYQARMHPEQYSNTFSDAQVRRLHDAMMTVCDTAVAKLAESDQFPKDWLMKHRWGKGKKDGERLPTGEKIIFLKVGGRTSAVVPSVQKKTGAVAGDVSGTDLGSDEDAEEKLKTKEGGKRNSKSMNKSEGDDDDTSQENLPVSTKRGRGRKTAEQSFKEEEPEAESAEVPRAKKQKNSMGAASRKKSPTKKEEEPEAVSARRRSGRTTRR